MNIILTRPLNDTENLMQELFSLGHKIMHVPTLKIKKANIEKINIEDYNALVFTSSNAVRNLNINGEKKVNQEMYNNKLLVFSYLLKNNFIDSKKLFL